jgi:hypothetical protein
MAAKRGTDGEVGQEMSLGREQSWRGHLPLQAPPPAAYAPLGTARVRSRVRQAERKGRGWG